MSSSEIITSTASNAYVIASAFLLESMLQWLIFAYLEISDILFGNSTACLVILMVALVAILVYRFEDCQLMPFWLRIMLALVWVEFTIVGAGGIITSAPAQPLGISCLVLVVLFTIFTFVGCYKMMSDTTLFVGYLCLWTFLSLIGCVLILAFLLTIEEMQVDYVKMFIMCIYPATMFNVAYDSRKINNPDKEPILLEDKVRYGLYLYGEYVAVLVVTLTLVGH